MSNMESWDIVFKNLTVGYGNMPVLSDVNAVLPAGKITVILGGSGCGKSTLLRHIVGLSRPIKGEILIGGKNLFLLGQKEIRRLRRRMGVLFQDGALLGALTLAQNVALPLSQHLHLPKKLFREAANRVLQMVGLGDFGDFYPNQLSGGMRKRAGLARAIIAEPAILLCDEPTGALDYKTSKEILKLIEEVNKKYGNTVIMVTHNDAIKNMADRVIKLRDGQIRHNITNTEKIAAIDLDW